MFVALLGSDPVWQELLRQEGVAFGLNAPESPEPPRILIIDRTPKLAEVAWLRRFAATGGSLVAFAPDAQAIWRGVQGRPVRIGSILPDDSTLFRNVGEVHVHTGGWIPSGATCGSVSGRGAVFAGRIEGSDCVLLPFDVGRLLAKVRSAARVFPARTTKPVFEKTAAVSRGDVRRLAANALRFLFARRGLPYVRLSYVPAGRAGTFGFRIDTDDDGFSAVQPAADLARQLVTKFTWFLATKALGDDLGRTVREALAGQDIQYHCFRHLVYPDYERSLKDFSQGLARLRKCGVKPTAAAAPYGEWNENWARAAVASGIGFSSEFCVAYDDLPFRVAGSDVLQVPVHPVCSSRLLAAGADEAELVDYFRRYALLQAARLEPCFLYDHPGKLMKVFEPMRRALSECSELSGGWTTMTEYAAWWLRREQVSYDWSVKENTLALKVEKAQADVRGVLEWPDSAAEARLESGTIALDSFERKALPSPVQFDPARLPRMVGRWRAQANETLRTLRRDGAKRKEANS